MQIKTPNRISVFEHDSLIVNNRYNGVEFTHDNLKAFQHFFTSSKGQFYSLIHRGVKFNSHVGVLQLGNLAVEILPKAEKQDSIIEWRSRLIDMLYVVGELRGSSPSSSALRLKTNFLLDTYIELFVTELEYLVHKGLIKQYGQKEGNILSLRGRIQIPKQIQYNSVHAHRFYTTHVVYNQNHLIIQLLKMALDLVQHMHVSQALKNRIRHLRLFFPEVDKVIVSSQLFERVVLSRKSNDYVSALNFARMILLNYHPDVVQGIDHTLALMFDMNALWEQFILCTLAKYKPMNSVVKGQKSKLFWKSEQSKSESEMRADILIESLEGKKAVIDTKWKNADGQPSAQDLRQMFAYHIYYEAQHVALVYPGDSKQIVGYFEPTPMTGSSTMECRLIQISPASSIQDWQKQLSNEIFNTWLTL